MELKPKIIETNTKRGDVTLVRRRYLKLQIAMLEEQESKLYGMYYRKGNGIEDLIIATKYIDFRTTLLLKIGTLKKELWNLIDIEEEYNS